MPNRDCGSSRIKEDSMENTETKKIPYYLFKQEGQEGGIMKRYYESRFWNQGGKQIAVIAIVTSKGDKGDWGAYIGTDAPDSYTEEATLEYVAQHGCKLMKSDAEHFFSGIPFPYRN